MIINEAKMMNNENVDPKKPSSQYQEVPTIWPTHHLQNGMVWYGMVPGGCLLSQKATSVTLKNHIAGLDVARLTPEKFGVD